MRPSHVQDRPAGDPGDTRARHRRRADDRPGGTSVKPNRRLIRVVGALAGLIVSALLIAACGGSSSPTVADVAGNSAATSSGGGGGSGTLNWEWELPTSWDPVTSTAGWDVHVLSLVYASITRLNPNGSAGPGLAQSWKYTNGGRVVTFTLRPGLKFSDGTPLTAAVVKQNIERGQKQANSTVASELAVIKQVVVKSPTQFTLDLTSVDYQVPELLGGKTGMIVNPTALKDPKAIPTKPAGAGPFELTSYVPDSHADLVRNPSYWDASNIHLAKFTVQDITNQQQILAALESGQVNVAYIPGNLASAAQNAGFKILSIPSEAVTEIDTQTTTAPFNNPKVTEAINYAINRQALVKVQTNGYASPTYQPFPKGYIGYDPKLANLYPYDPTKAKQLLAQAGPSAKVPITVTNGLGPADDSLAEQIQSQLQAVGLKVNIKDVPADTYTQSLYVNKTVPFAIDGTAGRESPIEMLDVLYDQDGLMNVDGKSAKESADIADGFEKTLATPLTSPSYGPTLRSAVDTAVKGAGTHIWLYTTPRIFAINKDVHGIPDDFVQQRWEGVTVGGS
jgi:ABC-type transport system substrate-binding protein